ncbi:MAG: hypothetical protein JW982_12725 [Spirochaetes bacterium]|nr:hypothetical protein [Spirochaetota bacterium]
MKKNKILMLIIFLAVLNVLSCDGTVDNYDFDNFTVINNSGSVIKIYYGEEKTDSQGYPFFEQHTSLINNGSSKNINLPDLDGLRCITVVKGGVATAYYKGMDFSGSLTIN